ncbi:D-xylose-proton symporter 3 [Spatholobus suberectus]|nr:D-xylose-proton symporter 3 [Spatholobus suberectus]
MSLALLLTVCSTSALLLYVGCYQISFGRISWLMVSEVFPLRTRGKGIILAILTNSASNDVVNFAFSPLKFHKPWGQLMKIGYQNSCFAHLVERFACLYTSQVSNLALM